MFVCFKFLRILKLNTHNFESGNEDKEKQRTVKTLRINISKILQ